MQKRSSSNFGKLAFIALFVAMALTAFRLVSKPTNMLQGVFSPLPPSSLLVGSTPNSQNGEPDDVAKFFAIDVTANGVDLVLHRPPSLAVDAETVTLVGSTNLVTATWEPFLDATFPAGETNISATVSTAMLDAHAVVNSCFFAFINSGDSDNDGLADWDERFNLKTDPHSADTDFDGMPDGWESSHGLDPLSLQDALLDADVDGVSNYEEYVHGTNPQSEDTDDDGLSDRDELGWVQQQASTSLPIANDNTVYICTPPAGLAVSGVYPFTLPFPVRLCGRAYTHGYADVKGVVHFLTADSVEVPTPLGNNDSLPCTSMPEGISVAAYWDDLCLHGGVSSIRLSDLTVEGRRYAAIEYHTVGADSSDLDLLTFRVVVCQQTPDEVVVQYGDLDDPHEGRSATFGVQGPEWRPCLVHSFNSVNSLSDGVSLVYHLGTGTDPCDADTDGDGMPDGWEHESGLLPSSAEDDDGAAGDPDDDGLSNWEEYILGTLPLDRYSFGEDIEDQEWAAWGFDMPFADYVSVQITVGDPSGSSSQIADWTIEPQTADGARLYAAGSGGEGATSLQGVSRVYVSPGANPGLYTITARHPTFENSYSTATFAVCKFKVEGVRFNYDRNSSDNDAINIRSNYDTSGFDYSTGEWANEGFVNYPVCYKGGITPKMQAKFSVIPNCTLTARFFAGQIESPSPVGGVFEENVQFTNGESDWVTFTGARSVELKVARGEAIFDWKLCGIENSSFVPSTVGATGPHRVYVVLADPVEPWSSSHESNQCAWTNALEWACAHAAGAESLNDAASSITVAINSSPKIRYTPGNAQFIDYTSSTRPICDLTRCVNRLNDHSVVFSVANCTDYATFVTSFSNLLGCQLYNSQIWGNFTTNPLLTPGDGNWSALQFVYHEVAWDGDCGDGDLVYDASLKYDGDDTPWSEPREPMHPVGVIFSDGNYMSPYVYRERLAQPGINGYDKCQACPETRQRMELE